MVNNTSPRHRVFRRRAGRFERGHIQHRLVRSHSLEFLISHLAFPWAAYVPLGERSTAENKLACLPHAPPLHFFVMPATPPMQNTERGRERERGSDPLRLRPRPATHAPQVTLNDTDEE